MTNLLAHQLRLSALEAEVTRFQRFARDAPIAVLFLDANGAAEFANEEFLRLTGKTREAFEEERFRARPTALPAWLHPEHGSRHESEYVRSDGTRVPILVGLSVQADGVAVFIVDLTAEKAARRALQESEQRCRAIADRLAEMDRRKDEFFGLLSHELRNPLAPIQNALHVLAHTEDAERAARARAVIDRQVGHLSRLVDDLLDVTRISRGRTQLHRSRVDLARIVRDTAEDHRGGLEGRGLRLSVRLPERPVEVDGDATRLAQILGNLLGNSAKFTPPGGTVDVRLDASEGWATLEVQDTGEGVTSDDLPRVFQPFAQADRSLARSRGGLGLGLTLVKGFVEAHGGTVSLESAGTGKGTLVSVRLPLAEPARTDAPGQAGPARPAAPRAPRVLVVEDNLDAAETLREALELEGMTVEVAGDGGAAVAAARRMRPHLVLCDIGLPGELDGYGVARAIRADPGLRDTRLVALTGYAGPEDRKRALAAGFERHLGKPTGIDALLATMSELLGGAPDAQAPAPAP